MHHSRALDKGKCHSSVRLWAFSYIAGRRFVELALRPRSSRGSRFMIREQAFLDYECILTMLGVGTASLLVVRDPSEVTLHDRRRKRRESGSTIRLPQCEQRWKPSSRSWPHGFTT